MRREQAGGKVGDRNADPHRPLAGLPGDRHQPAHALRDLIEAGPLGVGSALAETGNAGIDDARVELRERLVVDAQPFLHAGAEILDDDVGLFDHPLEGREAFRRLEIERHAALVAVQVLEIGTFARPPHAFLVARRLLDLDDVGAPIGELARAGRARPDAREIEHGEASERL